MLCSTLLIACEDPLVVDDLAGAYLATTFTVTHGGSTDDLLAAGAFVWIGLAVDGTTFGSLFVPGGNEDGSDLSADLAGTWALDRTQVSLEHESDTFLRDMLFDADRGRLSGVAAFGDGNVRIVLTAEVQDG